MLFAKLKSGYALSKMTCSAKHHVCFESRRLQPDYRRACQACKCKAQQHSMHDSVMASEETNGKKPMLLEHVL